MASYSGFLLPLQGITAINILCSFWKWNHKIDRDELDITLYRIHEEPMSIEQKVLVIVEKKPTKWSLLRNWLTFIHRQAIFGTEQFHANIEVQNRGQFPVKGKIEEQWEHRGSNRRIINNSQPRPKFICSYTKKVYILHLLTPCFNGAAAVSSTGIRKVN